MTTSLLNSLLRALLRWGAALVFCLPLRHRSHFWARACGMLFPLLLLAQLLDPLAQSTTLWQQQLLLLVLYVSFFALLGGMIYLCTDINKKGAMYCAVWSLLTAQTAYEGWNLFELLCAVKSHPLNMNSVPVKLLQVLQNKRIYRVGSSKPIDVNVRVITATNRNLEEEVKKGNFRQDLYYRINVFPICIPPLRQRKGDLYILINSVLDELCSRYHMKHMLLSEEALQKMMHYSWPGNVRELENVMERAITVCDSPLIYSEHILIEEDVSRSTTLKEQLEREERRILAETLALNHYKRRETMEALGLSKSVFYEKLKKYQLGEED